MRIYSPLVIMLVSLFSQGCYFCQNVKHIGLRTENVYLVDQKHVYTAPNGTMVCEAEATYYGVMYHPYYDSREMPISKKKRFLIGSPAAISNTVSRAVEADDSDCNSYTLRKFPLQNKNNSDWILFPSGLNARAPTRKELEARLNTTSLSPVPLPLEYELDGKTVQFELGGESVQISRREYRTKWGYPFLVLLVPAVPLDIITFPVQAFIVIDELNRQTRGRGGLW